MKNRILFYSSVQDKQLFNIQYFYKIDIDILSEIGFKIELCNTYRYFKARNRYDIAYLYFYKKSIFPAIMSRIHKKKVYFTGGIDELDAKTNKFWKYICQCFLFIVSYIVSTRCLITSNSDLKNIYTIIKKDFLHKLVYIPHCLGKDVEKYKAGKKEYDIFSTICWFGGRQKNLLRKGVDKALLIFSELIKLPEFKYSVFYLIGKDGKKNTILCEYIKKLKLHDNVVITDEVSTDVKYDILSRSKYYFQLSEYEGFGLAALEALWFKNIVIHSNKGGLCDFMKNYGIIYSNKDDINYLIKEINYFNVNNLDRAKENIKTHYTYQIRKKLLADILIP